MLDFIKQLNVIINVLESLNCHSLVSYVQQFNNYDLIKGYSIIAKNYAKINNRHDLLEMLEFAGLA